MTTLVAPARMNLGCGDWPLAGWVNVDESPRVAADVVASVPPIPAEDESLDDLYLGHLLEHLPPARGGALLLEAYRCLRPGGRIGVVVPDTRAVLEQYVQQTAACVEYPQGTIRPMADLDQVCALFLYSTVQPSPHRWSYDLVTLARALRAAGFRDLVEINRYDDPRIPVGAWYQCGYDARKP